ncbi:hypothetical protein BDR04DRAFT_738112 [Suillus decipiens]|nr:hypothetical protein BDR04DRAFT_738112 [Suillus decipiens]
MYTLFTTLMSLWSFVMLDAIDTVNDEFSYCKLLINIYRNMLFPLVRDSHVSKNKSTELVTGLIVKIVGSSAYFLWMIV